MANKNYKYGKKTMAAKRSAMTHSGRRKNRKRSKRLYYVGGYMA